MLHKPRHLRAARRGRAGFRPGDAGDTDAVEDAACRRHGRMADASAATLLHLGQGLGNGLANLHNAGRAGVPVISKWAITRRTTRSTTSRYSPISRRLRGTCRPTGEHRAGPRNLLAMQWRRSPPPRGPLTAEKICQSIGATCLKGAILSDEAVTLTIALPSSTAEVPRRAWITFTGGATGQGIPVAVGAGIKCPDRPVVAPEANGSAVYAIQLLWTMARERPDVTVLIFTNRSSGIPRCRAWACWHARRRRRSQGSIRDAGSRPRFRRPRQCAQESHRAASTPGKNSPVPLTRRSRSQGSHLTEAALSARQQAPALPRS